MNNYIRNYPRPQFERNQKFSREIKNNIKKVNGGDNYEL